MDDVGSLPARNGNSEIVMHGSGAERTTADDGVWIVTRGETTNLEK